MTLLHDAYTALLAGLTHRTGNEIHWHDKYGDPITIEPVDAECGLYKMRRYREDGGLRAEKYYRQNQPHGKCRWWHPNGQLYWERDCVNGQINGKSMAWYDDGTLQYEKYYVNGRKVTLEEWGGHNDATT